jgi:hypothetical protein
VTGDLARRLVDKVLTEANRGNIGATDSVLGSLGLGTTDDLVAQVDIVVQAGVSDEALLLNCLRRLYNAHVMKVAGMLPAPDTLTLFGYPTARMPAGGFAPESPRQVSRWVMNRFGLLDGHPAGGMSEGIIDCCARAKGPNRERFATAFPEYMAAVDLAQHHEFGVFVLRAVANGLRI